MDEYVVAHAHALRAHPALRDLAQLWCVENNWGHEAGNVARYLSGMPLTFTLNEGKKRTRDIPGIAPFVRDGLWTSARVKSVGARTMNELLANNAIHIASDMVCANPFVSMNDDEKRAVTLGLLFEQLARFRRGEIEQRHPNRTPGEYFSGKVNEQHKVVKGRYDDGVMAMLLNVCYYNSIITRECELAPEVVSQCLYTCNGLGQAKRFCQ